MHTEQFGSFLKVDYQFGDATNETREEVKAFMSAADQLEVELVNLRIDFSDANLAGATILIVGYAYRGVELCHAIKSLIAFKSWTGLFVVTRTLLEVTSNAVCLIHDDRMLAVLECAVAKDHLKYLDENPNFCENIEKSKADKVRYRETKLACLPPIKQLRTEVATLLDIKDFDPTKIVHRLKWMQHIDNTKKLWNPKAETWPQVYSALCQEAHSDVSSIHRRHVTGEMILAYAPYDEEHVRSLVAIAVELIGRLILCIRSRVEMHTAPE